MFAGITQLIINFMLEIYNAFVHLFTSVFPIHIREVLYHNEVNIYLFSDKGWFNNPIPIIYIIESVMLFLLFFFLLRLLWKATKKFISMIFGVFKV